MIRHITFEAYHYRHEGETTHRSERQDVTFVMHGDSVTVSLPPPAAAMLYLVVTPTQFVKSLSAAANPEGA